MPESAVTISSSLSVIEKKELSDKHFRWDSIRKFIFLATAYSHNIFNFDLFSKTFYKVNTFDFLMAQVLIGMPYMLMDGFINQYTRRIDGVKFLNPLLKGISFGLFIQTGFWALLQASFLGDSTRFLVATLRSELPWAYCYGEGMNSTCLSFDDIESSCRSNKITKIQMQNTAAHFHYLKTFSVTDRNVITIRCFAIGLIWLLNFFFSTVTDETLVKIYYFGFIFKSVSSLVVVLVLLISTKPEQPTIALTSVLNNIEPATFTCAVNQVMYAYGVGFLGFYDFGTMSPYTMLDTAVVIFSIVFFISALVRSWIIKILLLRLETCVKVPKFLVHTHYIFYAIVPLSTEFIKAHKLYTFYVYLNSIFLTSSYLTMLTLTMAKLLHGEFRSVKIIYFVGLICCCGLFISMPVILYLSSYARLRGFLWGINVVGPYLGGMKVAIVMWVYGVKRFSTDIQFWLGFKPTLFWTLIWRVLPLVLLGMMLYSFKRAINGTFELKLISLAWSLGTLFVVAILHIKTVSKYIARNNLASIFNASPKYGPPDPADRQNRRHYSETIQLRRCKHNCQVIDELIECNHMPLMTSESESIASSTESITKDIYRAEGPAPGTSLRQGSLLDLAHHHY